MKERPSCSSFTTHGGSPAVNKMPQNELALFLFSLRFRRFLLSSYKEGKLRNEKIAYFECWSTKRNVATLPPMLPFLSAEITQKVSKREREMCVTFANFRFLCGEGWKPLESARTSSGSLWPFIVICPRWRSGQSRLSKGIFLKLQCSVTVSTNSISTKPQ